MKKIMLTLISVVFVFTASVGFAGNSNCNNGNHYAYGHYKHKKVKSKKNCCDETLEIMVEMAKQIAKLSATVDSLQTKLDEMEANQYELLNANTESKFEMVSANAEPEETVVTDLEVRRCMWHKISQDAASNAGYTGVDVIFYSKNPDFEGFVAKSESGPSKVVMGLTNSNGDKITLEGMVDLTEGFLTNRDYFLTK